MSEPANSRPETAEERAAALLADAARAAYGRQTRATVALEDLHRPERYRLSEFQIHIVRQLLDGLIEAVEGDLRARLLARAELPDNSAFAASIGAAHVAIAGPVMRRAGLPDDAALATVLLCRADEYRIMRQLRKAASLTENGVLDRLMDEPDSAIAASAMRHLIAETRSNDRLDDPHIARADLPADVDRALVWSVAAALRAYGEREHGIEGAVLDAPITASAREMVESRTADAALESAAMDLAGHLDRHGLVDDRLLAETLGGARLALYIALLGEKAHLPFGTAWDMATAPDAASHVLLLRHLDVGRDMAAHLATALARAVAGDDRAGEERAVRRIEGYDAIDAGATEAAMRPWRLDIAYRTALARFGAGDRA
jgi:hypothetical protein